MPVGYLVTLIVLAVFTVIALAPPTRPRAIAMGAYLLTMTVNEVPHLAVGIPLTMATVLAVTGGDLGPDMASAGLLVAAALVASGIGVLAHRGIRARDAVADALRAAEIDVPATSSAWAWRTAITPLPVRPRNVVRVADLAYGPDPRHVLDVYHRRDRPTGGPVLVYLHGGGYHSGSKHHESRALLHRLAERGWVCVSATYRLRPRAGFEEHLADAHAALAWAREHAAGYGADPDTILMAGSSAGAHLSALCALDPRTRLSAVVCLYGYLGRYYGRTDSEAVPSTPMALPGSTAPPFFIVHGARDTMTSPEGSRALAAKLRAESSAPVVHAELPGGQHGFDIARSWRYSAVLDGIDAFLADAEIQPAR